MKQASQTSNTSLVRQSNIEEITECNYLKLIKDQVSNDKLHIVLDEIDTFKMRGYQIKYYLDTKRSVAFYDFFEKPPIGYKLNGDTND